MPASKESSHRESSFRESWHRQVSSRRKIVRNCFRDGVWLEKREFVKFRGNKSSKRNRERSNRWIEKPGIESCNRYNISIVIERTVVGNFTMKCKFTESERIQFDFFRFRFDVWFQFPIRFGFTESERVQFDLFRFSIFDSIRINRRLSIQFQQPWLTIVTNSIMTWRITGAAKRGIFPQMCSSTMGFLPGHKNCVHVRSAASGSCLVVSLKIASPSGDVRSAASGSCLVVSLKIASPSVHSSMPENCGGTFALWKPTWVHSSWVGICGSLLPCGNHPGWT